MGGLKFYDTGCGSVFAIVLSVLISSTRSVTFLSISCFWNKVVPIAPLRHCFPSVEMLISVPWNNYCAGNFNSFWFANNECFRSIWKVAILWPNRFQSVPPPLESFET